MDPIVERIDKLERTVRRFKWAGGVAVSLALVALVTGQKAEPKQTEKVIEADKIIAKHIITEYLQLSKDNEYRGHWITMDGTTSLAIFPPGFKKEEVSSALEPRLSLSVTARNFTELAEIDKELLDEIGISDIPRGKFAEAVLEMSTGGRFNVASMVGIAKNPHISSSWTLTNDGKAEFSLLRKNGKGVGGYWSSSPNDGTTLVLNDKEGRPRAVLGRYITIDRRTTVEHHRPESSLILWGEKGSVVHQVP